MGLWESVDRSRGGIGHTIEFRQDGTFVEAVTVLVDARYRMVGDRLFVDSDPPASESDPDSATTLRFDGSKLVATAPDGSVVEKERLEPANPGDPPIVGAWRHRHYTGAMAFERYTPEGRVLFRLPMTSSNGCYVFSGAKVTLARPDEREQELRFEVAGDELDLTGPDREPARYRRDEAGAWYDREHLDYRPPR